MPAKDDSELIPLPEAYTRKQLNALYREIPLKVTVSRELRRYFVSMANLYGIIRLKRAFDIISELSPSLVTESEFLAFAETARHEREGYFILGRDELFTDGKAAAPLDREIIADDIIDEGDTRQYLKIRERQRGKPFYIPTKEELLRYEDFFYVELTPEAAAFKEFLAGCFSLNDDDVDYLFTLIGSAMREGRAGMGEVLQLLGIHNLHLERDSDKAEFGELFKNFNNTTRRHSNRGHTPEEAYKMTDTPRNRQIKSIWVFAD